MNFFSRIFLVFFFLGSPETNVDTSENRHDFIDKLQRLKQQILDGIGQDKNEEDIKATDGQQQQHIMIARTIFTSDTSNERTITIGNWTFECNGPTQLRIHNVEGEQVGFMFILKNSFVRFHTHLNGPTYVEYISRSLDSFFSSVTYPGIWRCGCECGRYASLKEMIHLQWETTVSPERDAASPAGDAVSPEGDLLASPNFGIYDSYFKLS